MKGKPYRVIAGDTVSSAYTLTETSYQAPDPATPYSFDPPEDVYTSSCASSTSCGRQSHVHLTYDSYGNATRIDDYGDTSDSLDDRTILRHFAPPNTDAWIIGLPCDEATYTGTDVGTPAAADQIAGTQYLYDDQTACLTAPAPTRGKVTSVSRFLKGGASPTSTAAYDPYGNVIAINDPNDRQTQIAYDSTHTFPVTVTNALGQVTTTHYYGVDGVTWSTAATDPGLYGLIQASIDSTWPRRPLLTTCSADWCRRPGQTASP